MYPRPVYHGAGITDIRIPLDARARLLRQPRHRMHRLDPHARARASRRRDAAARYMCAQARAHTGRTAEKKADGARALRKRRAAKHGGAAATRGLPWVLVPIPPKHGLGSANVLMDRHPDRDTPDARRPGKIGALGPESGGAGAPKPAEIGPALVEVAAILADIAENSAASG